MKAAAKMGSRPNCFVGTAGSVAITTVFTRQTASAWRTAAICAGVPAGGGFPEGRPSVASTSKPAAAVPARCATPSGPPPPAWL